MKHKNRNKKSNFLSWLVFASPIFLAVFFIFVSCVNAGSKELIISELMYDPKGTDTGHSDWIEIYNNSGKKLILEKSNFGIIDEPELVLGKDGIHYLNCHGLKNDIDINPGDYVILADNADNFFTDYPNVTKEKVVDSTFSLSSNGDTIHLSNDKCATFFAEFSYENSWGGKNNGRTLELLNFTKGYEKTNWQQSWQMFGTPGIEKSEKRKYDQKIYLSEICPRPVEGESEFVELYNSKTEKEILDGWKITDRADKECLLDGKSIKSGDYLLIFNKPDDNCTIALNDSSGEELYLLDPNGDIVSKIDSYTTAKSGLAYAFDGKKWRWTKFLTPGTENIFNNLPAEKKTSIPKEAYTNMYADFVAKASDADGDKVKVTWDFGDGHKSYKAETRHKYEKQGKYKGSLKITDGSEDVIKEFTIKVEDYPERKVRIVSINANPVGKDTEGESITVLNKSEKKINFNGWSVATGANSKKLSNHPIKEDFEIKPGKTGEITRDICALTLNNKKGMVELRYPGGEVAHEVKYKKENKDTIKEGEVYEKKGEGWAWTQSQKSVKSVKSVKQDDGENNLQLENINSDEMNDAESVILPEEVGKRSEIEIENKLDSNPYLESTSLPVSPTVLGIETVRVIDDSYRFVAETAPEEHYVIIFLHKISLSINSSINKAVSYFL